MRRGGPDQECGDGRCAECMEEPWCALKAEPAGFTARWTEEWELRIERGVSGTGWAVVEFEVPLDILMEWWRTHTDAFSE